MLIDRVRLPNGVSIVLREAPTEGGGYAIEVFKKKRLLRRQYDGIADRARARFDAQVESERKGAR